jgi:hypothetical protein
MWQENPYYQYLVGEATFQWGQPCAASGLVQLLTSPGRKRHINAIFPLYSPAYRKGQEGHGRHDRTREKYSFPSYAELYKKVLEKWNALAKQKRIAEETFQFLFLWLRA